MIKFNIKLAGLASLLSLATLAEARVPAFEKQDRVVFIGDSITHGGRYHADIYLFYATRFPDQKFTAYNCGISGDTAPGTLKRFEKDIALHRPNVATIMLGMNDASAWIFDAALPLSTKLSAQKTATTHYTQAMDQIAEKLTSLGSRIVFIKPSIYDQTAELETKNLRGKNDQLRRYGETIDSLAEKYQASVVDFHTPMTALNHSLQTVNPSATVVGKDRVHPGVPGHFVMTYHFLKSQNMPQYVSAIRIDAQGSGSVLETLQCSIHDNLEVTSESLSFTATEQALPFPVSETQVPALDWVPFQHEFNRQVLAVDNLAPGSYALHIDRILVGHYTAQALKAGIDLAANKKTPQYQQALEVKARHTKQLQATGKLRSIAHVRHSMLSKIDPPVSETDPEALAAALLAQVEQSKDQSWYGYLKQQAHVFIESVPQEAEYQQQEAQWMQAMWQVNQPKPHHWELKKID